LDACPKNNYKFVILPRPERASFSNHGQGLRHSRLTQTKEITIVKSSRRVGVGAAHFNESQDMSLRILLVEDHEDSRQGVLRLLQHWGFDVATADTLQDGLSCLETQRFDAIVSDIALPDGTGYALVTEAKRRTKDMLTIALSGYGSPGDVHVGRLAGFDHHLMKPCNCHQLRSILGEKQRTAAAASDSVTAIPLQRRCSGIADSRLAQTAAS
jgi:CheY-like chemotaxis protein